MLIYDPSQHVGFVFAVVSLYILLHFLFFSVLF